MFLANLFFTLIALTHFFYVHPKIINKTVIYLNVDIVNNASRN